MLSQHVRCCVSYTNPSTIKWNLRICIAHGTATKFNGLFCCWSSKSWPSLCRNGPRIVGDDALINTTRQIYIGIKLKAYTIITYHVLKNNIKLIILYLYVTITIYWIILIFLMWLKAKLRLTISWIELKSSLQVGDSILCVFRLYQIVVDKIGKCFLNSKKL